MRKIVLVCLLVLTLVSCGLLFKKPLPRYTYDVVAGKIRRPNPAVVAEEVDKMFSLQHKSEVIEYLVDNSENLIEAAGISQKTLSDVLSRNLKMKKGEIRKLLLNTHTYTYKYTLQPYDSGHRWVDQWIVFTAIPRTPATQIREDIETLLEEIEEIVDTTEETEEEAEE